MKMIATSTPAAPTEYAAHVHNCQRNAACEPSYIAPVPGVPYVQLYVDFGTFRPVMVEFQLVDPCNGNAIEQIFPSNYVVGQTPEGGWYGVFKYFNTPLTTISNFVIWLSATNADLATKTFFTEMLGIEPCLPLMKIKACQPELATTTGFDLNGLYYGLPVGDFLGLEAVRYFHIAWVRMGKVRETSNKGTFKSNLIRNFRTTIEKIFQVETELVPQWYKNVLLAIYARGAIQINDGTTYLVSDLAVEPINEDDLTWKPFAQVKETFRLFYGCDVSDCPECCSPVVLSATVVSVGGDSESDSQSSGGDCVQVQIDQSGLLAAIVGQPYSQLVPLTGTAPFTLDNFTGPAWMSAEIVGSAVQLTGTPAEQATDDVFIQVSNCGNEPATLATTISAGFNFFIYNNLIGAELTDIVPAFFVIETGNYPLLNGQIIEGTHGGFSGDFGVDLSATPGVGRITLFVNGVQVDCENINFAGMYNLTIPSVTNTDLVEIYIEAGIC